VIVDFAFAVGPCTEEPGGFLLGDFELPGIAADFVGDTPALGWVGDGELSVESSTSADPQVGDRVAVFPVHSFALMRK
jgi:hypothetical protein